MARAIDRRRFIGAAAAVGGVLALAPRVFAQAYAVPEDHRRILEVARREVARAGSRIWRADIAGIADFGLPSSLPRLHFANLESGTVRSFLVTHGRGSDPENDGLLKWFSNVPGSYATSRGAYVSYEWYTGMHGISLRLGGLDPDNSNVLARAIVMHSAPYARLETLARFGKLGRSDGCLAMAPEDFDQALLYLSGGRLIFADRLGIYPASALPPPGGVPGALGGPGTIPNDPASAPPVATGTVSAGPAG
jgi:hypothetical protein